MHPNKAILVVAIVIAGLTFLSFLYFSLISIAEKEKRAAKRAIIVAFTLPFLFLGGIFGWYIYELITLLSTGIIVLFTIYILFPRLKRSVLPLAQNNTQIDERNTMFSRKEISSDEALKAAYYQRNPDNFELDESWRKKPGLMSEKSAMYNPLAYAAADASFYTIGKLKPFVNDKVNEKKIPIHKKESSTFIKEWAKKLGALDVGICHIKPYHYYSYRGRGEAYGNKIEHSHEFAIAITVEMEKSLLSTGPAAPTLMESSQQYLNSGIIAIQLAQFIRNLGYEARAHIDGDYELVCPLVARDAGLGEIGRMGLLMTPKLGPRVRIAVVTTNLPLINNSYSYDASTHEFCKICKKCADVCPGQAISHDDKSMINGNSRWQINQEKCFAFWCTSGTDCGRCMSVCPYSHPDNLMHNAIRWGIRYSKPFSHLALWMDHFFYGRKPKPNIIPEWISASN